MSKKKEREKLMSDEDRIASWKKRGRRCRYCNGEKPVETITDRLFGCCYECAEWDNNAKVIKKSLPCICCGKQLVAEAAWGDEKEITVNNVDNYGFGDGMATRISAGYGSKLDCNVYMIALCDDCAKQKMAQGWLTFVYNCMPNADGSPNQC